MNEKTLTPEDIDGPWPFTSNKVKIVSGIDHPNSLHVRIGLRKYRLNGVAKTGAPLEQIWKKDKNLGFEGARVSISPIFKACKELLP